MTKQDFDIWYQSRYRHTTSAYAAITFMLSDFIAVMLSFGAGFFIVNAYNLNIISFRSFVTYWPFVPAFILLFYVNNLYPGVSLAPAEELQNIDY